MKLLPLLPILLLTGCSSVSSTAPTEVQITQIICDAITVIALFICVTVMACTPVGDCPHCNKEDDEDS